MDGRTRRGLRQKASFGQDPVNFIGSCDPVPVTTEARPMLLTEIRIEYEKGTSEIPDDRYDQKLESNIAI